MTKYRLTKGEQVDSNTVNLNDLIVGELYTIKPETGYFTKEDLEHAGFLIPPYEKTEQDVGEGIPIVLWNNFGLKTKLPTQAKEFLTGTKLDVLYIGPDHFNYYIVSRMPRKEMDTFVYINNSNKRLTTEKLWDYIQEHEDVDAYRAYLEELISVGKKNHNNKKYYENVEKDRTKKEKVLIKREQ